MQYNNFSFTALVPARYILAILGSIAMGIVYGLKVNLSVAMVAMLNHTELERLAEQSHGPSILFKHNITNIASTVFANMTNITPAVLANFTSAAVVSSKEDCSSGSSGDSAALEVCIFVVHSDVSWSI